MTKKTNQYRGKLNTKIKYKKPVPPTIVTGSLDDDVKKKFLKELKKYYANVNMEKLIKLLHLLKHYEIDYNKSSNPFLELSLKMAERHVPGFKVQGEIKRKETKWDPVKLAQLYLDVEDYAEKKPQLSNFLICNILRQKISPWNQEKSAKSLSNRYTESQDSLLVNIYKTMREIDPKHAKKNFQDLIKTFNTIKLPK